MQLNKNDVFIVDIIDMNIDGFGIAKINGFPIFIENTITNEVCEIKMIKVTKKYGIGKLLRIISESKNRVAIHDPKGTWVGTMPLQHLNYETQLLLKQQFVAQTLKKVGGLNINVASTLPCDALVGYRNKAQIPVRMIDNVLTTGFYRKNSHTLIPIEDFIIQDKYIDFVVLKVRDILRKYHILAYDEITHSGVIREIIVRRSAKLKQVQVVLVALIQSFPHQQVIIDEICQIEEVVSVVLNINSKITNVILGDENIILYRDDYIFDELFDLKFKISSRSFYQVNHFQTEKLYALAYQLANLQSSDIVLDAYCGIGTIGLPIAKKVNHVYGIEVVADAITMANENIKLNNIHNATYICGLAEDVISQFKNINFDVLFVDPARKGLDEKFIKKSVLMQPKKIVYISCNPTTFARDLKMYHELGYCADIVYPVDMFPQTAHVECVALLERK